MVRRATVPAIQPAVGLGAPMTAVPKPRRSTPQSAGQNLPVPAGDPESSSIDTHSAAIIRSKVEAAPVRAQTLTRQRLMTWLDDHAADRLKLIVADAGFGKTTLLADFARQERVRCLWYKLEHTDRDWMTFVNYLIAAMREVEEGFGRPTASLIGELTALNPTRDVVVGSFIAETGGLEPRPTILILDDFHLVDDSDDVRAVVERLLERSPPWLTFLVSSRRRPPLRLGRLTAQGEVSELTTADLRFSAAETEELFNSTYGYPLEPDLLAQVDARTEGWGASLQLLHSSIRSRKPSEARSFIRQMSGAEGSLYDFLAEEVLGHLPSGLQDALMRVALLDRILPKYAAALLTTTSGAPPLDEVVAALHRAEELGLLSRSSVRSGSHRMHPLLRDFLLRWLTERTSLAERQEMHRRVARAAEPDDWLTACRHYIEAGDLTDAMRTLSDAAPEALGNGSWAAAVELMAAMPEVEPPPPVQVIRARALVATSPAAAIDQLDQLSRIDLSPLGRAMVRQCQAAAHWRHGTAAELEECLDATIADSTTPRIFMRIAHAHKVMMMAGRGEVSAPPILTLLVELAESQRASGHHYYSGISLHNAATCAVVMASYHQAVELCHRALESFERTGVVHSAQYSTYATMATACLELGLFPQAESALREATRTEPAGGQSDAFSDSAAAIASLGRTDEAVLLLDEAQRRASEGHRDLTCAHSLVVAEATIEMAANRPTSALSVLEASANIPLIQDPGLAARLLTARAVAAATVRHPDATELGRQAVLAARKQGARRYEARASIARAIVTNDANALVRAIAAASAGGELTLLETASAIGLNLNLLSSIPAELYHSMSSYPARWLPVLRMALEESNPAVAQSAAELLARLGTASDIPRLVAFERTRRKRLHRRKYAQELLRRVSDTLLVRDLGRVHYELGARLVPLSDTRRKAAALLLYLVTRPQQTATREQIIEDLWPESDADAGGNSLHQTLYFLRRDIDPWYSEESSAPYLTFEAEMVWLDPVLVVADSSRFLVLATAALNGTHEQRIDVLRLYPGRFAPDFEYEDWAIDWRERLHAVYLGLAHRVVETEVERGSLDVALKVCHQTLAVDPTALGVEYELIRLYWRMGAGAAAQGQYEHYARSYRLQYGAEPETMSTVTQGLEAPARRSTDTTSTDLLDRSRRNQ